MKKIKNIIATVVTAGVMSMASALSGYCSVTVNNFDLETAAVTYTQVEGTIIYAENGVTETSITNAINGWLLTPEGVRVKLVEYGCELFLSSTASAVYDDMTVGGLAYCAHIRCYKESGVIAGIIRDPYIICFEQSSSDLEGTVLHEIGHIFDETIALLGEGVYGGTYYQISDGEEWQNIYITYQSALASIDRHTAICMYNSSQAFAECFRLTYQNPEALIAACPVAYEYILKVVAQYTE